MTGSDVVTVMWVGGCAAVGLLFLRCAVSVWTGRGPYASVPRRHLAWQMVWEILSVVVAVCAITGLVWAVAELTGATF